MAGVAVRQEHSTSHKVNGGNMQPASDVKEKAKSILKEIGIPMSSAHELRETHKGET